MQRNVQPRLALATLSPPDGRTLLSKPNIIITESGSVITIELEQLILTIKPK